MQSLYEFLLTFSPSQILKEACYTHRPNLLVVILNEFDADLYQAVKRFGDITAGVATQCIVCFHPLRAASRFNTSVCRNGPETVRMRATDRRVNTTLTYYSSISTIG